MTTPITTSTPHHVAARTLAASDVFTEANWLTILRSHAQRQDAAWLRALMTRTAPGSSPATLAYAGHPRSGYLLAVGATTTQKYDSATLIAVGAAVAHPAGPTLTGVSAATDGDTVLIAGASSGLGASRAYPVGDDGELDAGSLLSTIALVQGMVYCAGSGLYVACGTTGAATAVETSPDGVTWTLKTSDATETTSVIGTDGDLRVLVCQVYGAGESKMSYSADGGVTWSSWVQERTTGNQIPISSVSWDEARGVWIAQRGDSDYDIYATSSPTLAGSWNKQADGGLWTSIAYGAGKVWVMGEAWVHQSGAYSFDGGTTWQQSCQFSAALPTVLQQLIPGDGRFWLTRDGTRYLTGKAY